MDLDLVMSDTVLGGLETAQRWVIATDKHVDALNQQIGELEDLVDELREVLAPLLDDPLIDDEEMGVATCRVCLQVTEYWRDGDWRPRPPLHTDDCPVLNKDHLLGR